MYEGFEEIYPVEEDYSRFDQRNTAFGRAARAGKGGYRDPSQKIERILKGTPDFSLIDYAFSGAALTARASALLYCTFFHR